jgi:3-oxoadipate enol-lactonase
MPPARQGAGLWEESLGNYPAGAQGARSLEFGNGVRLAYGLDDYTDAWTSSDVVLMLHGIAETGAVWRPWVPHVARRFRVLRPDLRGFGASSPLDPDAPARVALWADDLQQLVVDLGLRRVHLVGAKLGSLVAVELAQRRPAWLATLTIAGMLISPGAAVGHWVEEWTAKIDRGGVEAWVRATMPGRMGGGLAPEAMEWWSTTMGRAPAATVKAALRMLPGLGEPKALEAIACPTLVIAGGGAAAGAASRTYDQRPAVAEVRRWQARIPRSELQILPVDSYHFAATHPDDCAELLRDFLDRQGRPA